LINIIYSHDARRGAARVGGPASFRLIPEGKSWFDQGAEQGIPIGNLTSQFGANVYLCALDHFIQRELKPGAYLRYMDDLLLLDRDPEKIRDKECIINRWLADHRSQRLNTSKTHFTSLQSGITYLGYQLRQTDSSQQPLQIFPEPVKKWQLVSALRKQEAETGSTEFRPHSLAPMLPATEAKKKMASINSRLGILVHSRSFLARKLALDRFVGNTTVNRDFPADFADQWCPFKVKKGYRAVKQR
jgi:hypothetical protein